MKASTITKGLFALTLAAAAAVPAGAFPKKQAPGTVPAEAAQPSAEEKAKPPAPAADAAPPVEAPRPAPVQAPEGTKPKAPAASAAATDGVAAAAKPAPKLPAPKPAKAAAPKPAPAVPAAPPPPPVPQAAPMPVIDPAPEQARWAVVCQKLSLDCSQWSQFPGLMPFEVGTRLADGDLSRSDRKVAVAGWPYDMVFDKRGQPKGRIATDLLNQPAMAAAGQDVVVDPKPASMRKVATAVLGQQGGYVAFTPDEWARALADRMGVPSIASLVRDAAMAATLPRTLRVSVDGATAAMLLPSPNRVQPPHDAQGMSPGEIQRGMSCFGGIAALTFPAPADTARPGETVLAMVDNLLFCNGGPDGPQIMERIP